jgi:type IV pilus assembly protein PilY1
MKTLRLLSINWLFIASLSFSLPLTAHETDIFGTISDPSTTVTNPNVLFIIDNSNSMTLNVPNTNSSRSNELKKAFSDYIKNVEGINAGLMQLNREGAAILAGVSSIDQPMPASFFKTFALSSSNRNDAEEITSTGQVLLNTQRLTLGYKDVTTNPQYEINLYLTDELNNKEERLSDGRKINTGSSTQFNLNSNRINGLRFTNINIPRNANIIDARLYLYPQTNYTASTPVNISIRGHNTNNAPTFAGTGNVRDRWTSQGTTTVNWEIASGEQWTVGLWQESANIAPIIQQIVNRGGWNASNAIALFLQSNDPDQGPAGTLYRNDTPTTQGTDGQSTKLKITYSVSTPTKVATRVGFRFDNVYIPKNSVIKSAYLEMTTELNNNNVEDNLELDIQIEDNGNTPVYTTTNSSLAARSKIPMAPVKWMPDPSWPINVVKKTADFTPQLQALVNKSDWCGNNALALQITPSATSPQGNRVIKANDAFMPATRLVVNYLPANPVGCVNEIISGNSTSALREDTRAGWVGSDLTMVENNWYAFRFKVELNQGARVMNTQLKFQSGGYGGARDRSPGFAFDIWGEAIDNSPAVGRLSTRARTKATANWAAPTFSHDTEYTGPNIAPILQEIVNRAGWQNGNFVTILLKATTVPAPIPATETPAGCRTIPANLETGQPESTQCWPAVTGGTQILPKIQRSSLAYQAKFGGGAPSSLGTIAQVTRREDLIGKVQNLAPVIPNTPLVDALFEAQQYFAGKPVDFGQRRMDNNDRVSSTDSYITGARHTLPAGCTLENYNGYACRLEQIATSPTPSYISPINGSCQSNHIVLLTDGAALGNHSIDKIKALTNRSTCDQDATKADERCGRTLVNWMAYNDVHPQFPNSQVKTHTIAFNLNNPDGVKFLEDLSYLGKGSFSTANTANQLLSVLNQVQSSILDEDTTFTPAGISINQFNRLHHRKELYFSVFKPATSPRWSGNLKRYKLDGNPLAVRDMNNEVAVDPDTGFFKNGARSVWSNINDGGSVEKGGAASLLPDPATRKVFTHLMGSSSLQLTNPINALTVTNVDITPSMLQANNSLERDTLISWIRGKDVMDQDGDGDRDDARLHMGDPMFSSPAVVTYGGTDANPDNTVFMGTNEGFLQAIDTANGQEHFAYMPESLLKNIKPQMENSLTQAHLYGMDASPVVWRHDNNQDILIKRDDGDFVYLYAGMRRGGRDYHALDVTDRAAPALLWSKIIQGGSPDFADLGQTWSTPVKTKVKIGSTIKDVLLFAGGFDPAVDNQPNQLINVTMGNAIYMVDAKTGDRLWMAGKNTPSGQGLALSKMNYAIPATIEVLDVDQDGSADQFFVGDLGGQIWRFHIIHGATGPTDLVKGGRIANFGAADMGNDDPSISTNNRRFFFKPDASFVSKDGQMQLVLAIGSGSLIDPLSQVTQDRFYVLNLNKIDGIPDYENLTSITESNLLDRTNDLSTADFAGKNGWFIRLEEANGEKTLAASLTINNQLMFTTYQPNPQTTECHQLSGIRRFYVVNLSDGTPVGDANGDNIIDKTDRYRRLKAGSLAGQPRIIFGEKNVVTVMVGAEIMEFKPLINQNWQRSYWYQKPKH